MCVAVSLRTAPNGGNPDVAPRTNSDLWHSHPRARCPATERNHGYTQQLGPLSRESHCLKTSQSRKDCITFDSVFLTIIVETTNYATGGPPWLQGVGRKQVDVLGKDLRWDRRHQCQHSGCDVVSSCARC